MTDCYHCAQAVPPAQQWTLREGQSVRAFCCPACRAVYECIHASGYDQYYARRLEPAIRPTPAQLTDDYQDYDQLIDSLEFVSHVDDVYTATMLVPDIRCSACAWLIETALTRLSGVTSVRVSLFQKQVRISWQTGRLCLSQIMQTLASYGYQPEPWTELARKRSQREQLEGLQRRLGVAGLIMMQVGMMSLALYAGHWQGMEDFNRDILRLASLLLTSITLLYCATPFLQGAYRALSNRQVSMEVPISIALLTAFSYSAWSSWLGAAHVYFDTVSMFVFFLLLSRFFEAKSRDFLAPLSHQLLPPVVHRRCNATNETKLAVRDGSEAVLLKLLRLGDEVLCKPGEAVASDGIVIEGSSSFDESVISGESEPVLKRVGDAVLAGSINLQASIWFRASCPANASSIRRIDELTDIASTSKPAYAQFIDRISPHFTLCVLALALVTLALWWNKGAEAALIASVTVLIISCPCALALATPLALAMAQQAARQAGVVPVSGNFLQQLPEISDIVFDKTGTLSGSELAVTARFTQSIDVSLALQVSASLQQHANHPMAGAFLSANPRSLLLVESSHQAVASGVSGEIDGITYRLGKPDWAIAICQQLTLDQLPGSADCLLCSATGQVAAFDVREQLRSDAPDTCRELKAQGYRLHIFSGDRPDKVAGIADRLGIGNYHAEMRPQDKIVALQELRQAGGKILMLGDGVNDAPVLAAADVSFAMQNAADISKAQADAVFLSEHLSVVPNMLRLAAKTRRIIRQNILWAILYNSISLPLAMLGVVSPWLAALGMSLSSLIVVANSQRLRSSAHIQLFAQDKTTAHSENPLAHARPVIRQEFDHA